MFDIADHKVQYYLDRFLHPQNINAQDLGPRGLIGVIGEVGSLEGAIMLAFGTPWYSERVTIDEHFSFVDPAHRASSHAKSLIAYAKHMTDELRKVDETVKLVIGVLSTKRTAAKVRLYERQLQPSGAFFVYPAPDSIAPPKALYRI